MEEKELLDNLKNKIKNNIEITSDEIIELKEKLDGNFKNNWLIVILLLFFISDRPMIKGVEEQCTETTTDTTIQQEI